MKMKDINEAFGRDDFGLKGHGAELDNDEKDIRKGYDKDPVVVQIGKVLDSQSNPNPIDKIYTDDGEEHKIGPNMARAIKDLLRGQIDPPLKPQARAKLQDIVQTSKGLKTLMTAKSRSELSAKAMELTGASDIDMVKDKSIY
jgi:hypothetical protein